MDQTTCPTCGATVRLAGSERNPAEGGTRYYVPVEGDQLAARVGAQERILKAIAAGFCWNEMIGQPSDGCACGACIARAALGADAGREVGDE